MTEYTIGVIGGGFVGTATRQLTCDNITVLTYDIDGSKCNPRDTSMVDIINSDIIMICVPTPSSPNGLCDVSIIETVLENIDNCAKIIYHSRKIDTRVGMYSIPPICIRSTVPPSYVKHHQDISFFPEFLTEQNFLEYFKSYFS